MKKILYACVLLLFPFLLCGEESVYPVTDRCKNVFTIKGADFFYGKGFFLIKLGDRFLVKSEQKVPLPDNSYCFLIELMNLESGETKDFTSTVMNDNDLASVKQIVIHKAKVEKRTSNGILGPYVYYIPRLIFDVILEDGSSYCIWYGSLNEKRSLKEAQKCLDKFLKNLPKTVRIQDNNIYQCDEKGNKAYWMSIEFLDESMKMTNSFLAEGPRRTYDIALRDFSEVSIRMVQQNTCPICGENGDHILFDGLGSIHTFTYLNHELVHMYDSPTMYIEDAQWCSSKKARLLRVYEMPSLEGYLSCNFYPKKKKFISILIDLRMMSV